MNTNSTPAERLVTDLHKAFDYTGDNNRDLLGDEMYSLAEVLEELEVERAYQFLIAYIYRNEAMINSSLEQD